MFLEVKRRKANQFISMLKESKEITREFFIRGWSKNSKLMWLMILKHQERCTVDDFSS